MENIGLKNKTYRIRTTVDSESKENKLDIQLNQSFDSLEILSLRIKPLNEYRLQECSYGVVVGRVYANGGFGVPNAKVSVFIPVEEGDNVEQRLYYNFTNIVDITTDGIRYNILPDEVDKPCHQDVGTMPHKSYLLDNDTLIEIFDKYYKYTTTTNASGDYMLFGVPKGSQVLHLDVDLSDIGLLSQTPRDMMYKGYNATLFDSPTKFKSGTDLDSLPQIKSQNKSIFVYPYWGETNELKDSIAVTRCDLKLDYTFEPTCIFMGGSFADRGNNSIGKKCVANDDCGKMSELTAGEGTVEMIRYNMNSNIEYFPIMGNRVIDGDGTWCYQIPMNLDYVTTDEFGNTVPTDDPTKGIPTRAKVRFRIALDETGQDAVGNKRARFLVPHNPGENGSTELDYEFGTNTKESSFVDLLWNKVYSVKNFIPRIDRKRKLSRKKISKTRDHTGIKGVNHSGKNNPIPYNNLTLKLTWGYKFRCVLNKTLIMMMVAINFISWFINMTLINVIIVPIITIIKGMSYIIPGTKKFRSKLDKIKTTAQIPYVCFDPEYCSLDEDKAIIYVPIPQDKLGKKSIINKIKTQNAYEDACDEYGAKNVKIELLHASNFEDSELATCIEVQQAEENETVFYNFYNDWLNGSLYFPLWFRKFQKPRKVFFNLFKKKGVDKWCSDTKKYNIMNVETCDVTKAYDKKMPTKHIKKNKDFRNYTTRYTNDSYSEGKGKSKIDGLIHIEKTMLDEIVYYYNAEWFKTDIILLGSLDENDRNGIPQFFKYLPISTYQKPNMISTTDTDNENILESSGENWSLDRPKNNPYASGLFYQLGCLDSNVLMLNKSCFNVRRLCELSVDLDQRYTTEDNRLVEVDGVISNDEISFNDSRAMFATMNSYVEVGTNKFKRLSTRLNTETSMNEYVFDYYYPTTFDGNNKKANSNDKADVDYVGFKYGDNNGLPYGADVTKRRNSFYFYFGLNEGKTAIEKFNSQFYADCGLITDEKDVKVETKINRSWCDEVPEEEVENLYPSVTINENMYIKDKNGEGTQFDKFIHNDITLKFNRTCNFPLTITSNPLANESEGCKFNVNVTDKEDNREITLMFYKNTSVNITVEDSEGNFIFDEILSLLPPKLDFTPYSLDFNVDEEVLKDKYIGINKVKLEIKDLNKNDYKWENNDFYYSNESDRKYGSVKRLSEVDNVYKEMGGSYTLWIEDKGYEKDNFKVVVTANIDGKSYENNDNFFFHIENDDVKYDLITVFMPRALNDNGEKIRYNVKVTYCCLDDDKNQIAIDDNSFEDIVTFNPYTPPIITFSDDSGHSLTKDECEVLEIIYKNIWNDENIWNDLKEGDEILNIRNNFEQLKINDLENIKKVLDLYNKKLYGDDYETLNDEQKNEIIKEKLEILYGDYYKTLDETKKNKIIKIKENLEISHGDDYETLDETEKNEIIEKELNDIIKEELNDIIKEKLISFYHIFTYTSETDGLFVSCDNEVTDLYFTNFSYNEISEVNDEEVYTKKDVTGKGIDLVSFNGIFSDFTEGEAIFPQEGIELTEGETIIFQEGIKLTIDSGFNGTTDSYYFKLYDRRMRADVTIQCVKYEESDNGQMKPIDNDKRYVDITINNGFLDKEGNLNYSQFFGDELMGVAIKKDEETPYGRKISFKSTDWDFSTISIYDGENNKMTLRDVSANRCTTLGIGGILLLSEDVVPYSEMRSLDNYQDYFVDKDIIKLDKKEFDNNKFDNNKFEKIDFTDDEGMIHLEGYLFNEILPKNNVSFYTIGFTDEETNKFDSRITDKEGSKITFVIVSEDGLTVNKGGSLNIGGELGDKLEEGEWVDRKKDDGSNANDPNAYTNSLKVQLEGNIEDYTNYAAYLIMPYVEHSKKDDGHYAENIWAQNASKSLLAKYDNNAVLITSTPDESEIEKTTKPNVDDNGVSTSEALTFRFARENFSGRKLRNMKSSFCSKLSELSNSINIGDYKKPDIKDKMDLDDYKIFVWTDFHEEKRFGFLFFGGYEPNIDKTGVFLFMNGKNVGRGFVERT